MWVYPALTAAIYLQRVGFEIPINQGLSGRQEPRQRPARQVFLSFFT